MSQSVHYFFECDRELLYTIFYFNFNPCVISSENDVIFSNHTKTWNKEINDGCKFLQIKVQKP